MHIPESIKDKEELFNSHQVPHVPCVMGTDWVEEYLKVDVKIQC